MCALSVHCQPGPGKGAAAQRGQPPGRTAAPRHSAWAGQAPPSSTKPWWRRWPV